VHLRRALLLFAMVLGFAALAATISQAPRRQMKGRGPAAAPPRQVPLSGPEQVRLSGKGRPRVARVRAGDAATLVVSVPEPGQVKLQGLDLLAAAEPSTPATFPLRLEPGRYRAVFTPAGSGDVRAIGTVLVRR